VLHQHIVDMPKLVSLDLWMPEQGDVRRVASALHHASRLTELALTCICAADVDALAEQPAPDALQLTGLRRLHMILPRADSCHLPHLFAHLSAMASWLALRGGLRKGRLAQQLCSALVAASAGAPLRWLRSASRWRTACVRVAQALGLSAELDGNSGTAMACRRV
jgi:hypothetical protein